MKIKKTVTNIIKRQKENRGGGKMTITYSNFCDKCGKHLEVLEHEQDKPIICLECLKKCLKNV